MFEKLPAHTILLTGATGLVGSQLLARLLDRGTEVAVLVRPTRRATIDQRIEQCLAPFEEARFLPRPRIIAANLSIDGLGISKDDYRWLAGRSLRVLHCAGSIRFDEDAVTREPYASNVDGTLNLLRLAVDLKCHAFHFVSTAYVQNGHPGICKEARVDSLELTGNDYEKSKILAEKAVRECEHVGAKTIHRPSIVIGDSQTGYTSTYHGFYAPLQVAMQFAKQYGFDADAGRRFREQLGLAPTDSKNLVPVDWVAECIVQTVINEMQSESPRSDVRYLHWTNPNPVPCEVIQKAISSIVAERYRERPSQASPTTNESEFRQLLNIYEAYFRADPVFDNQASSSECPNTPCPKVGSDLLVKLGTIAANTNFGWPQPSVCVLPHRNVVAALRRLPIQDTRPQGGDQHTLEITLLGPGAPEPMTFGESNSRWQRLEGSTRPLRPQSRCRAQLETLANCLNGASGLIDSMANGLWLTVAEDQELATENIQNWMSDVQSVGCPS